MRNLLDGLEEAGLDFSHVVASNVYVDNMDDYAKMNATYAKYFPGNAPPTRTTVSPLPPVPDRKPDSAGRVPGAAVGTVDEALDYLRELERANEEG